MMNIIKKQLLIFICVFSIIFCCLPMNVFAYSIEQGKYISGQFPMTDVLDVFYYSGEYLNGKFENLNTGSVVFPYVLAYRNSESSTYVSTISYSFGSGSWRVERKVYKDGNYIQDRYLAGNNRTLFKDDIYYSTITQYSGDVLGYVQSAGIPVIVARNVSEAIQYALDNFNYSGGIPVDPNSLGFIKASYYVNNALLTGPMTVVDTPETITWQNTSTTGYDLNLSGVQIRFMIKDRSVYQRNENAWGTGTIGTINNFITNVTGFLSSNLFPNGSWQKSWLRGDVTRSDTHEQFFGQKFTYPGSRGKASFNWLASYRDHPQIQLSTYANDMLSTNKSFYESLYQNTLGDFTIPYISWDIYAQIIAPDGTEGNWLKIDKHGAPFQEQGNRLDGGVTDEPVKITPSIPDNNTWNDGDETPLEDDDDDDPLPVGYVDPASGDTYNDYNNYTYNYDNRSWIENHYDNSTIESVNDGIDWIKLFPGFFGLFLKFFGAFLPSWAVACVTIGIPIILGLILFRLIKGVIPFV